MASSRAASRSTPLNCLGFLRLPLNGGVMMRLDKAPQTETMACTVAFQPKENGVVSRCAVRIHAMGQRSVMTLRS